MCLCHKMENRAKVAVLSVLTVATEDEEEKEGVWDVRILVWKLKQIAWQRTRCGTSGRRNRM